MNRHNQIINAVIDLLIKEINPNRIILFGSRAKGNAHEGSDFDFAISGTEPKGFNKDSMDALRGLYQIDLVYLDDIDSDFRQIILNTGKIIYDRART
ncbi:MAG: putative nucleotidyltransferase [Candidatus Omnitrophota bacterium]|jgi:predicted nucleotidyltransferase